MKRSMRVLGFVALTVIFSFLIQIKWGPPEAQAWWRNYLEIENLVAKTIAPASGDTLDITARNFTITGDITIRDGTTVETYIPANRVVRINKASQLSSWSKQAGTAGMSIYQMSPGITYLVDLQAIYLSGVTDGHGVSAFNVAAWSGVSFFLPDAATYSGPAYDVTIGIISGSSVYNGASTYAGTVAISGATTVQVWPYPGMAGLTAYHLTPVSYASAYRSGCTPQALLTEYTTNGATSTYGVASGASYWELNRVGEFATFGLENQSGVSAFVRSKKVVN